MSISKEVRIGLLASISLVVFFTGFYFLKGADLFSDDRYYYCYYDNVQGLLKSANVEIKGLYVGHVADLTLEEGKGVKVTLAVRKSVVLPNGTMAILASPSILSGKIVRLDIGTGGGVLPSKSVLPSAEDAGVVDNVTDQITPLVKNLRKTLTSLDTVISEVNMVLGSENREAFANTLKSVSVTADNLAKISTSISNEGDHIRGIVANTHSFTDMMAKNNDSVRRIISNLNNISGQLANAPIQKTVKDLETTISNLKAVIAKLNSNEGSLGMAINNKEMYTNLNNSLHSLDALLKDLKEHPSKYVNVSIFGGKKK